MIFAIYCELQLHVQQCLHSWNFVVTNEIKTCNNFLQKNDLIWVMKYIYHTLTHTILPSSSSLMHNFLHSKKSTQSDMTQHIYILHIYWYIPWHNNLPPYMYQISLIYIQITWQDNFSHIWHCYLICVHLYHYYNSVKLQELKYFSK